MNLSCPPYKLALPALLALAGAQAASAQQLVATLVSNAFDAPTILTGPPGDARLFVCDKNLGLVRIIKDGVVLPTPFLDVSANLSNGFEQGLLGLAFHPDYANNRRFFVSYTDASGASLLEGYLADATDPDIADPSSGQVVFGPLAQPNDVHNGGCIEFGTDGKLYYGLGEGGDSVDRAQDLTAAFGKLLRFDVDIPFPHVPADNPFVGDPTKLELIWSYGLRNPWRFSFDSDTGDLWIGDVGGGFWEEVNYQAASSPGGENYGWACTEGADCLTDPFAMCQCTDPITFPLYQYAPYVNGTCAVIGGHVYHGDLMPSLRGRYVFTDWCTQNTVWSFELQGTTVTDFTEHTHNIPTPTLVNSLSKDGLGELYILNFTGGEIWRLEEFCQPLTQNFCSTSPNSAGAGAVIASTGSTSVLNNDFVLEVSGASTDQPGLFYYGPNQIQIPFGEGFRCVGGGATGVFRLSPAVTTDSAGEADRYVDFDQPPVDAGPGMIQPGDTWYFQFWYRDPLGGGSGFNLSDGLEVGFCP